jgi:N-ethylmaleimide reductase
VQQRRPETRRFLAKSPRLSFRPAQVPDLPDSGVIVSNKLFSPFTLGPNTLKNRVVMAPMTRSRAEAGVPTDIMATYYGQRAGAGLIITEGTSPSPNGLGYARIPGLYNAAQVAGWRKVTDAVKAGGGKIFVQLMHCGRIGHPTNFVDAGARLVAPSALAAPGTMYTDAAGPQEHPVPEAMTEADIHATIQEYADSAALAIEAGFDGVELHAANGYLIDQFLGLASNHRTDAWGGSVEGRTRFALEVARAVAARIGAGRVGVRVSPYGVFNGQSPEGDADHEALYASLGPGALRAQARLHPRRRSPVHGRAAGVAVGEGRHSRRLRRSLHAQRRIRRRSRRGGAGGEPG